MGAKIRIENQAATEMLVQVELTGATTIVPPSKHVLIDTDFDDGEEVHIEIKSGRLVIWGGVAASFIESQQTPPPC